MNVLLLDTDDAVRAMLAEVLTLAGHEVTAASSFADAAALGVPLPDVAIVSCCGVVDDAQRLASLGVAVIGLYCEDDCRAQYPSGTLLLEKSWDTTDRLLSAVEMVGRVAA